MRATAIASLSLVLLASTIGACGGRTTAPWQTAPDNAADSGADSATDSPSAEDGTAADAAPGCEDDASGIAVGDGAQPYVGAVVASSSPNGGGLLSAGFPFFGWWPATTGTTGATCGCSGGIPDPAPSSSAGDITVKTGTPCGPLLALLPFDTSSGFAEYTQAHVSWTPGDAFAVSAPGDPAQVHAFAGMLQTGVPLADLSPPIGPSAQNIVIPLNQPLVVSWKPEGQPGESVAVSLEQSTSSSVERCTCVAPDSAGTLTIPADILSKSFVPTGAAKPADLGASRAIDTAVGADNAVVHLVSIVETGGPVILE